MNKKVYCKDCKYIKYTDLCYRGYYCNKELYEMSCPMNKYMLIIDNYEKQNKKNNCKYFKRSWFSRMRNKIYGKIIKTKG